MLTYGLHLPSGFPFGIIEADRHPLLGFGAPATRPVRQQGPPDSVAWPFPGFRGHRRSLTRNTRPNITSAAHGSGRSGAFAAERRTAMAICPSEHMCLLLQALKDNDREGVTVYPAEMLLWLAVAGNPLPKLRMAVVGEDAVEAAQDTLRRTARSLRTLMCHNPALARQLEDEAAGHEQVADVLRALCNDTDFVLVQP